MFFVYLIWFRYNIMLLTLILNHFILLEYWFSWYNMEISIILNIIPCSNWWIININCWMIRNHFPTINMLMINRNVLIIANAIHSFRKISGAINWDVTFRGSIDRVCWTALLIDEFMETEPCWSGPCNIFIY